MVCGAGGGHRGQHTESQRQREAAIPGKMFSRSLLAARNAVKARAPRRTMGSVTDYKPPTMSDLPVPQGSWQDAHSAKQKKYNLQLLSGVVVLGGTLTYLSNAMNFCWGPGLGK